MSHPPATASTDASSEMDALARGDMVPPLVVGAPAARTGLRMRKTFFGAACIALQPIILSALMLPVTAYVIRSLGPTDYGYWAMAMTFIAVVAFVSNPGLRGTFIRSVAREPESAARALAEQMGVRLALSGVAVVLAVVLCLLMGYSGTVVLCTLVCGVGLVLLTVSTTMADLLQALQRLPAVAAVNMVGGLFLSAASVAAVLLGAGPVGVAMSYLVGPFVSILVFGWILRRQHFPVRVRWDGRKASQLIWGARHIASQQVVWSVSANAQALMVPRLMGATLFGYFSAGALLANRLSAMPEGLCSAAYPAMVDASRRGPRSVLRVFFKFLALVLPTSILAALSVTLVAGPIARLLFPGRHEVCQQVMQITVWMLPAMGVHFLMGYLLNALDKDAAQARMTLIGSAFSLVLTAAFVWKWGIIGACWSMVLRYVLDLAMVIPYLFRTFAPLLAAEAGTAGAGTSHVHPATAAPGAQVAIP